MNRSLIPVLLIFFLQSTSCNGPEKTGNIGGAETPGTVRIYEQNPRYLQYQGRPILLITSAEHYGAVVNLDFDYSRYLETLQKEGFNYTRIFCGPYFEPVQNVFGIQKNTLAPDSGKYIGPWVYRDGIYDLEQFNPPFFERLTHFVGEAAERGIVVEVTLFSSIYAQGAWELLPFNPGNNEKITGEIPFREVHTLAHPEINTYQEAYIRKVVRSLNGLDNLFYEIQNEPWADNGIFVDSVNQEDDRVFSRPWQKTVHVATDASLEWQGWVESIIRDEESTLEKHHLVAQNICNFRQALESVPSGISLINFHYAHPEAVSENLELGVVLGLDETGFMPQEDRLYLDQAWRFMLAGGGLYNNLDYSFTVGMEDGTWPIPGGNPGWGGTGFRKKLGILAETLNRVPFWKMEPSTTIIRDSGADLTQHGLEKPGKSYLVFLENYGESEVIPDVPKGKYRITWIDPDSGDTHTGRARLGKGKALSAPFQEETAVLLIESKK